MKRVTKKDKYKKVLEILKIWEFHSKYERDGFRYGSVEYIESTKHLNETKDCIKFIKGLI